MRSMNPLLFFLVTLGCAHRVPPASAEEHQRLAEAAEDEAVAEEAKFDPSAGETTACMEFCFTTWTNPTEAHLREAHRLRRIAEQHREARRELLVAEERACAGISERDRDISPFFHRSNITSITAPKQDSEPFIIEFGVPQTSVEQFRRLVDCHIARNGSVGYEMPEMDYCPLGLANVEALVTGEDERIRIELRGADAETREALRIRVLGLE